MKKHDEAMKKRRGRLRYGALLLAAVLFLATAWEGGAYAAAEAGAVPAGKTWTVTDPSDTLSSPGENTLRGIVGRAADGDAITFAPGIAEIPLQGELVINKSLTIAGSSSQKVTIRQTMANFRVLSVPSAKSVVLRRLKITGGRKTGYGNGGGILNSGTLMIESCDIVDNQIWIFYGGGLANENGGTLTIRDSLVKGNSSAAAGGIWNAGALSMENCVVEENVCAFGGGGIHNVKTMTLTNCTIRNNGSVNATYSGGGVYNSGAGTVTMSGCTVQNNSAVASGGGIENSGGLTLINCIVTNNTAGNGGGINSGGSTSLMLYSRVYGNTPDQIRGSYTRDSTCIIGSSPGTASTALGGVAHGVSPTPRATSGEVDVTKVENDLGNSESDIFKAVKNMLTADLNALPGDASAGLSSIRATLYNAFVYEDVPLADASGEGELTVEFTASWPRDVRYYAALAEYEEAAAGAAGVKGYALPERGVQFEVRPGQPLPDGVTPPDFYKDGEGLMTWRNVIADNGPLDHNRAVGVVTFRVASIRAEARTAPSGSSGCSAGDAPPASLLLVLPVLLVLRRYSIRRCGS